jgi:hypothetical protein
MSTAPKRGRGRPRSSKNFRLVAVPHAKPEHRKIGQALLALAVHQQEQADATTRKEAHDE